MLVVLKCPSCGADLEVDNSRDVYFCQFCGTKIINQTEKVQVSGSVKLDTFEQVNNLLKRGYEFESQGRFDEAESYFNKALDMDVNCQPARDGLGRIMKVVTKPNVHINFMASTPGAQMKIAVPGFKPMLFTNSGNISYTLPAGPHTLAIKIAGRNYHKDIFIKDRNTQLDIQCIQGHRNQILINGQPS